MPNLWQCQWGKLGTLNPPNHQILGRVKKNIRESLNLCCPGSFTCHKLLALTPRCPDFDFAKDHEHLCYVNPFLPASEQEVIREDYSCGLKGELLEVWGDSRDIHGNILGIWWELSVFNGKIMGSSGNLHGISWHLCEFKWHLIAPIEGIMGILWWYCAFILCMGSDFGIFKKIGTCLCQKT